MVGLADTFGFLDMHQHLKNTNHISKKSQVHPQRTTARFLQAKTEFLILDDALPHGGDESEKRTLTGHGDE
jgi:hypothetical protein